MAGSLVWETARLPSWVKYIRQRIAKNKNFICFIEGPTGSGKSWASLSIAEQVDPDFTADQIVFNGHELMNLINSGTLKEGSCIVFEEAGVEMNNRNWQSDLNQMINFLFQTFRHRNFILILNAPYIDFLDSSTRKLMHAKFKTMSLDLKTKTCKIKPHLTSYNGDMQKHYRQRLRVVRPEGTAPISFWNVPKPSQRLIDAYEPRKRVFTDRLNEKISAKMAEYAKKADATSEEVDSRKPLTLAQQKVIDYFKEGKLIPEVAKELDIKPNGVRRHLELIRKKGYSIMAIKEKTKVLRYEIN